MPPLARWILLRRDNDASCHLGGRQEAWHSYALGVRDCGPFFQAQQNSGSQRARDAWRCWLAHIIERGVLQIGGALGLTSQVVDAIAYLQSLMLF